MATTLNLQSTVSWAAPFLRFTPQLTGSPEPSLTNANLVKQTMLGPPFVWRQNRGTATFPVTAAAQDYTVPLPDFGFLEQGSLASPTGSYQIGLATTLAVSSDAARPSTVTVQSDDNAGNLRFRFNTAPDANYTAQLDYQRKAVPMVSLASLWAPLPDELAYIFNWGYLAFAALGTGDPRFGVFSQRFVAHLLGAQDSISDLARNIFLANWTAVQAQAQRSSAQAGVASQARGGY